MRPPAAALHVFLSLARSLASTQNVASSIHYGARLDAHLGALGKIRYPPWSSLAWSRASESHARIVFRNAQAVAFLDPLLGVPRVLAASLCGNSGHTHGSGRWVATTEIKKGALLRDAGVVLCRTSNALPAIRVRIIAVQNGIPRPARS